MSVTVDYDGEHVSLVFKDSMWAMSANAALRLAETIIDMVESEDSDSDDFGDDDE